MKKIFGFIFFILIIIGGYFGYLYYQHTYVGTIAYAKVSKKIPPKEKTKDNIGKIITDSDGTPLYSYNYVLTFIDENGEKNVQKASVIDNNPQPLQPDSYVKALVSKKRIIKGPTPIRKEDIPQAIQKKLE